MSANLKAAAYKRFAQELRRVIHHNRDFSQPEQAIVERFHGLIKETLVRLNTEDGDYESLPKVRSGQAAKSFP